MDMKLMIGDWIFNVDDGQPQKVLSLDRDGWVNKTQHVKPLEITRDILEKNGWSILAPGSSYPRAIKRISEYQILRLYLHAPYLLQYENDRWNESYDVDTWQVGDVMFVHQLQHALWDFGLSDECNNWKV